MSEIIRLQTALDMAQSALQRIKSLGGTAGEIANYTILGIDALQRQERPIEVLIKVEPPTAPEDSIKGWIAWDGKSETGPEGSHDAVRIQLRDGRRLEGLVSGFRWRHWDDETDILAYQLL